MFRSGATYPRGRTRIRPHHVWASLRRRRSKAPSDLRRSHLRIRGSTRRWAPTPSSAEFGLGIHVARSQKARASVCSVGMFSAGPRRGMCCSVRYVSCSSAWEMPSRIAAQAPLRRLGSPPPRGFNPLLVVRPQDVSAVPLRPVVSSTVGMPGSTWRSRVKDPAQDKVSRAEMRGDLSERPVCPLLL